MNLDTVNLEAVNLEAVKTLASHSNRSRLSTLTGVQVISTGGYVPPRAVSNAELTHLGCDSEWILQRTGIASRRHLMEGLATSDMAVEAAQQCLETAGVDRQEIDMVVVATMTPDHLSPSVACLVQERLGLRAAAMDLNAACAGFMYALTTGAQFVKTGCCRRVLVIGADTNSRIINPRDPKTYPLFGDGAGAVVLGRGRESQGFLAMTLGADGRGADLLQIPAGGSLRPLTPDGLAQGQQYMQMDGRSVFKWAVRLVTDMVRDLLCYADVEIDDVRLVVLHQANVRILEAAAEALNLPRERLLVNLREYGNTSAASIPLGLDQAMREGRIEREDHVLLCGFGGGLAWGAGLMRW